MKNRSLWQRIAMACATLSVLAAMTGCVSAGHFVDGNLKEVNASAFKKTDPSHAVQLLFDFQTKGVDNARATSALRTRVADQIAASGVFDKVSETPVAGGALLTITFNNVPLTDINQVLGVNNDLGEIAALIWAGQH